MAGFVLAHDGLPALCHRCPHLLRQSSISITAVAKYSDGAYKAAGVFGFFATIVFAIDFYLIFNEVAKFLKQGDSGNETTAHRTEEENSNSDSDSD